MATGIDVQLVKTNSVVGEQVIEDKFYDIQIGSDGDINTQDFFDTAVLVSLFAERRANEAEVFDSGQRRGWIGNESTPGIEIGSKIWLHEQPRLTRSVINSIQDAASESLKWLVEDDYALAVGDVKVSVVDCTLVLSVTIKRSNGKIEQQFFDLWQNTGVL